MQFIRDEDIKTAFVTMINKLIFGRKLILQPLLDALRGMSNSDNLSRIQELVKQIEKNAEQRELLVKLMAKGYLEPALFNRENNELQMEADNYMGQKEALIHALNGELSKVQEVSNLIKFTNKAEMINTFNEQIFNDHIEKIIVYSRVEIGFVLKCGITLRERM
jgi:site-specific DNA recombinase